VIPTPESEDVLFECIRDFDPGLVCFTSVYSVFHFLAGLAERVKKRHPASVSPWAALMPPCAPRSASPRLSTSCAWARASIPRWNWRTGLESGKSPEGIANLWIKQGDRVERNGARPFLEDLAALPFPDREMWLPWVVNPSSRPSFLAGRGCPFQCTYCCNHALRKVADGKYVRLRSPANIAEEILEMKRVLYLMEDAYLEVETLGVDREWPWNSAPISRRSTISSRYPSGTAPT